MPSQANTPEEPSPSLPRLFRNDRLQEENSQLDSSSRLAFFALAISKLVSRSTGALVRAKEVGTMQISFRPQTDPNSLTVQRYGGRFEDR